MIRARFCRLVAALSRCGQEASRLYGRCAFYMKDYAEALKHLLRADRNNPNDPYTQDYLKALESRLGPTQVYYNYNSSYSIKYTGIQLVVVVLPHVNDDFSLLHSAKHTRSMRLLACLAPQRVVCSIHVAMCTLWVFVLPCIVLYCIPAGGARSQGCPDGGSGGRQFAFVSCGEPGPEGWC